MSPIKRRFEHLDDHIPIPSNVEEAVRAEAAPMESTHIGRVQMILAEKRTSLAVLRTGIALLTLPLSLATLLIATSRYYDVWHNLHFLVPLFTFNSVLVVMGFTLIARAWGRIKRQDEIIEQIKNESPALTQLIK